MSKKTNKGQLSTWGIPGKARALAPLSLPRQGRGGSGYQNQRRWAVERDASLEPWSLTEGQSWSREGVEGIHTLTSLFSSPQCPAVPLTGWIQSEAREQGSLLMQATMDSLEGWEGEGREGTHSSKGNGRERIWRANEKHLAHLQCTTEPKTKTRKGEKKWKKQTRQRAKENNF